MQIPRLHPDTVEEVKQRAEIVDVISEHVVLQKRGKDFVGLCPFHDEKSPSFTVSPTKQMYYCFGCQAGGNVIKFLMERGKRPFGEVVLDLARRYQVSVQTLEPKQRQELQRQLSIREHLYEILAVAAQFYVHALHQSQGKQALEYLLSRRQIALETIQQFQLGYAPASWETLYRYLVEQKRYSVHLVEQAGLIVPRKSGGGHYDQFRDRLMIPIHDIQGRVIGFGARSLGDEQPKYLNSPETDLFNKGKTLFALDKARAAIAKQDQAVVVEGYFDAIALHAVGITNVVASLGTALGLDQVRQLLRYTESKQIVLNFDADSAGTKAAERAIGEIASLAYNGQVQLRILNLPDGKDADEFLKSWGNLNLELQVERFKIQDANFSSQEQPVKELNSQIAFQHLLDHAPLWLDWQIQQLLVGKDLKQADKFQQVNQQIVKLVSAITNEDQLTHYLNRCAELLSQGDARRVSGLTDNLLNQIAPHWEERLKQDNTLHVPVLIKARLQRNYKQRQMRLASTTKNHHPPLASADASELEKAEALLLRFYLHCPEHRQAIIDILEAQDLPFSLSHHRFLWQQILSLQEASALMQTDLISKLQDLCIKFEGEMVQFSPLFHLDEYTQINILRAPELITASAARMERVICEKQYRYLLELWKKTDYSNTPATCQYYSQKIYLLKQRIKELDQKTGLESDR